MLWHRKGGVHCALCVNQAHLRPALPYRTSPRPVQVNHRILSGSRVQRHAPLVVQPQRGKLVRRIIRAGKLQGYVFRCQQRVGTHILEFYCPASRLALEIIRRRETPAQTEAAERRLARLERQHDIQTLRFWHEWLVIDLYWVSGHIITALRAGQRWPMTWVPPPAWQRHWPDLRAR